MCVSCSHYKLMGNTSGLLQTYGWYNKMIKTVLLWSLECVSSLNLFAEWPVGTSSSRLAFIIQDVVCSFFLFCSMNHCLCPFLIISVFASISQTSFILLYSTDPPMTKYGTILVTLRLRNTLSVTDLKCCWPVMQGVYKSIYYKPKEEKMAMRVTPAGSYLGNITQVGQMKGKSFKGIAYQCKYANLLPS